MNLSGLDPTSEDFRDALIEAFNRERSLSIEVQERSSSPRTLSISDNGVTETFDAERLSKIWNKLQSMVRPDKN